MDARHRIVLVEDDGGVRQAMERLLRGSGYEVDAFESAEALQARFAAEAAPPECDCVVCDVRLPGMCGFELHRRLSEQGPVPPWIYITAHDDPSVRRQAEADGAAYLLKPFGGRALLALVEQAIPAP